VEEIPGKVWREQLGIAKENLTLKEG